MNWEIRGREKLMQGLESLDSLILKGRQIHHNFIKPHLGLDRETPAEAAGIKVEGDNKWMTIIQNAASSLKPEMHKD
jgi:putative transposase